MISCFVLIIILFQISPFPPRRFSAVRSMHFACTCKPVQMLCRINSQKHCDIINRLFCACPSYVLNAFAAFGALLRPEGKSNAKTFTIIWARDHIQLSDCGGVVWWWLAVRWGALWGVVYTKRDSHDDDDCVSSSIISITHVVVVVHMLESSGIIFVFASFLFLLLQTNQAAAAAVTYVKACDTTRLKHFAAAFQTMKYELLCAPSREELPNTDRTRKHAYNMWSICNRHGIIYNILCVCIMEL